ncbi:MAG: SRPBCC domain-containing protein [Acidobacteria bacterium]|nr:SRPBCC domain-containing protein [Acidobacteriota bacterium]
MTASDAFEHTGRVIRVEMRTPTPADRVWSAWADPAKLSQWFTDRTEGEVRPGRSFTWIFERFGARFPYEVLVATPPSRLVLRGSPPGRRPFFLEVLIAGSDVETTLTIVNSGFSAGEATEEEHEGVLSGWEMALAILKEYLERHYGRPKAAFFAMQPAVFAYEGLLPYFLEEPWLREWLTASGSIRGEAGALYHLELRGGGTMSGRVLAVTRREVALSWDEIGGVCELKAFSLGPNQRAVAVRGIGWEIGEERASKIERGMAKAIDRLVASVSGTGTVH